MHGTVFTRRQVVQTLLALGIGGVCISGPVRAAEKPAFRWDFSRHDPTPENFADLSSFLTLADDLEPDAMAAIYKAMMDEPWGSSHITRLHKKISDALEGGLDREKRPPAKDAAFKLDDGEKWFAGHLLMAWYTGMYFNAERPTQRLAYETALMFRAVRGSLPVPMIEPTGYAAWTELPEQEK